MTKAEWEKYLNRQERSRERKPGKRVEDAAQMREINNLSMDFLRFILASCGMLNTTHEHLRFMFQIRSLILLLSLLYVSLCKNRVSDSPSAAQALKKAPPAGIAHRQRGLFSHVETR